MASRINYIWQIIDDGDDEPTFYLNTDTIKFGVPDNATIMKLPDGYFVQGRNTREYFVFAWICERISSCVSNPNNHLEYLDFSNYNIFKTFKKIRAKNRFTKLIEILSRSYNFKNNYYKRR